MVVDPPRAGSPAPPDLPFCRFARLVWAKGLVFFSGGGGIRSLGPPAAPEKARGTTPAAARLLVVRASCPPPALLCTARGAVVRAVAGTHRRPPRGWLHGLSTVGTRYCTTVYQGKPLVHRSSTGAHHLSGPGPHRTRVASSCGPPLLGDDCWLLTALPVTLRQTLLQTCARLPFGLLVPGHPVCRGGLGGAPSSGPRGGRRAGRAHRAGPWSSMHRTPLLRGRFGTQTCFVIERENLCSLTLASEPGLVWAGCGVCVAALALAARWLWLWPPFALLSGGTTPLSVVDVSSRLWPSPIALVLCVCVPRRRLRHRRITTGGSIECCIAIPGDRSGRTPDRPRDGHQSLRVRLFGRGRRTHGLRPAPCGTGPAHRIRLFGGSPPCRLRPPLPRQPLAPGPAVCSRGLCRGVFGLRGWERGPRGRSLCCAVSTASSLPLRHSDPVAHQ